MELIEGLGRQVERLESEVEALKEATIKEQEALDQMKGVFSLGRRIEEDFYGLPSKVRTHWKGYKQRMGLYRTSYVPLTRNRIYQLGEAELYLVDILGHGHRTEQRVFREHMKEPFKKILFNDDNGYSVTEIKTVVPKDRHHAEILLQRIREMQGNLEKKTMTQEKYRSIGSLIREAKRVETYSELNELPKKPESFIPSYIPVIRPLCSEILESPLYPSKHPRIPHDMQLKTSL